MTEEKSARTDFLSMDCWTSRQIALGKTTEEAKEAWLREIRDPSNQVTKLNGVLLLGVTSTRTSRGTGILGATREVSRTPRRRQEITELREQNAEQREGLQDPAIGAEGNNADNNANNNAPEQVD